MTDVDNSAASGAADSAEGVVASMAAENQEVQRPEDVPEKFWDAEKKEVKNDAVLTSYLELEKQFGSFTGAPDEYIAALSDELKEQGVELADEDPMIETAKEFAKEVGMNQDGFSKLMNLYGMVELAKKTADQEAIAADIASLGDNADRRLNNLTQWANKNLGADMQEGFKDLAVGADAVKALEQIVSMTRNAPVEVDGAAAAASISTEEVQKMQFEKDENGNRRIQTDPEFKKRYEEMRDAAYGTEPFNETVG